MSSYNLGEVEAEARPSTAESRRERRWRIAFGRVNKMSRVQREDLFRALDLCGFNYINPEAVQKVYSDISSLTSLSLEDFLRFVRAFYAHNEEAIAQAFKEADKDDSGTVSAEEIMQVLRSFGVQASRCVLDDVFAEVDSDRDGTLSLEEFTRLYESLQSGAGLTRAEREELAALFKRFDAEQADTIATDGLVGALGWLGMAWSKEEVVELAAEVDIDGSSHIDQKEFFIFMRKVRERELQKVRKIFQEHDTNNDLSLSVGELESVLQTLGYVPEKAAITEVAEDCNLASLPGLGVDDLLEFMRTYRAREGLTKAEVSEVEAAFSIYNASGDGKLQTLDVGKVLRWFGYNTVFEMQQLLIDKVDVDKSGWLDLSEMRKLIRMYWEEELRAMEAFFRTQDEGGTGLISVQKAAEALHNLPLTNGDQAQEPLDLDLGALEEAAKSAGGVDVSIFVREGIALKKRARNAYRQNSGYSPTEMKGLRKMFEKYDLDHSGRISYAELGRLVRSMFPVLQDDGIRCKLHGLLREVDSNLVGSLDFQDFVRIFRQFSDLKQMEKASKEAKAVQATGFSTEEVHEFRELFLSWDMFQAQELNLSTLLHMMSSSCSMTEKRTDLLVREFHKASQGCAAGKKGQDCSEDEGWVDFPEFLRLMRALVDENFIDVAEARRLSQGAVALEGAQE